MESVVTAVDPQALLLAAQRLDVAAELLQGALRTHWGALQFGAGGLVRNSIDELVADVLRWQRAAEGTAVALRTAAHRHLDVEARAVEALR